MKTPNPPLTAVLVALAAVLAAAPARANPSMSNDFQSMMGWLSNEVVQGLSFNAGSMFDPPNELRPWHMQPDVSFGIGMVPLNKKKFPKVETQALAEKQPEKLLPSSVTFPNLALHLRLGLPGRFDFTVRGANMTVPKGYKLAPGTEGNGQSNSIGFGVRRHFFGGRDTPLLSVAANYNHVKGNFNFVNAWQRLELVPGFQVDSRNVGRLEWNVNSIGMNAVVSQSYGMWTPFIGGGWSHMSGSMKARLQADFATPLISPAIGEASDHPEENQARVIIGTQLDRSRFSFFVNGEMKAIGIQSGKAFIVQMGVVTPFRIGSKSFAAKGTRRLEPTGQLAKEPAVLEESERLYLYDAPAPIKPYRRPARAAAREEPRRWDAEPRIKSRREEADDSVSPAWGGRSRKRSRRRPTPAPAPEEAAPLDPVYRPQMWDYRELTEKAKKRKRRQDQLPEMIFIQ